MHIRRHGLFLGLLLAGIGLRVVVMLAYRPALLFVDSYRYLRMAIGDPRGSIDPAGYAVLLKVLRHLGGLPTVVVVQHLLALGMAVAIYALLVRRGVRTWVAALAAAPMLLDAYVLQISHLVMSDLLFIAFLFGGLAVLAWTPRPNLYQLAGGGALLAMAGGVRTVGLPVIAVALLYMLFTGVAAERSRWAGAAAMVSAFAVVMGLFAGWTAYEFGHAGQRTAHGHPTYGRAASFADCATLDLPAHERALCPNTPLDQRENSGFYTWDKGSPIAAYEPPQGMDKYEVGSDFALRVFRQQPLDWAWATLKDFWSGISEPKDETSPSPVERWQFRADYQEQGPVPRGAGTGLTPANTSELAGSSAVWFGPDPGRVNPGPAGFLRAYQLGGGYLPPFAMGLCLLPALAGVVVRSPLRATCLLWTVSVSGVLLGAATIQFSWRYQLPGIALFPVAAALGLTALYQSGLLKLPVRRRAVPTN